MFGNISLKSIQIVKETEGGDTYGIEISGDKLKINLIDCLDFCYGRHGVKLSSINRSATEVLDSGTKIILTDISNNTIAIIKE